MSEIENYKNILRKLKKTYCKIPWEMIIIDRKVKGDDEYLIAIQWAVSNGLMLDNSMICYPDEVGKYHMCIIRSYPFTLQGEEFLKTDNEKEYEVVTKAMREEVGKKSSWFVVYGFLKILTLIVSVIGIIAYFFFLFFLWIKR